MTPESLHTDAALLHRMASGDKDAFSSIYHHYWDQVYTLALTMLKSPARAEDAIQEVFIKLWLNREKLPSLQAFHPYFMVMVRNEIINAVRQDRQRLRIISADEVEISGRPENPDRLNLDEIVKTVNEALNTLPDKQKQVFILSRDHSLTHDQIAEKLQLSKKTVANLITLSLNQIRNSLEKKGLLTSWCLVWLISS